MKLSKYLILIVLFSSFGILHSQTIDVERVITTNFPTLRAEFRVTDASGNEVRNLSDADLELKDLGNTIPFNSPTCPPDQAFFSLIMVFDASGSMDKNIGNETYTDPTRLNVIRNVARTFIDELPDGQFEAAMGFFSNRFFLKDLTGFTTDKDELKDNLNNYASQGGTNYTRGFLGRGPAYDGGAFSFIDQARYEKRVIIFLTDGFHDESSGEGIETGLIQQKARETNTTIYSIVIGPLTSEVANGGLDQGSRGKLQNISRDNGGESYENLVSEGQIQQIYSDILRSAQTFVTSVPCYIDFESDCNDGEIELTYKGFNPPVSDIEAYTISDDMKPNLDITDRTFLEINPTLNQTKEVDVTIKAEKNKLKVTGFNSTPANIFTISDWGGSAPPFTLNQDETRTIKVSITPDNREFYGGNITFEGTGCSGLEMTPRAGFIFAEDIVFANVNQGDQETKSFTRRFCNLTDEPLDISSITINGGAHQTDFGITSQNSILAPGECIDIEATFRPTDQGDRTATYVVRTDKGDFEAALKGGGAGKPQITASAPNFNKVNCTNPKSSITVTVTNDGPVELNITDITVDDGTNFTYTGVVYTDANPLVIPPNSSNSVDVTVDYTPLTVGVHNTNLVFTNDSDDNPYNFALSGEMLAIDYSVSETEIDFGTICANPGDPITQVINLTNLSSFGYSVNATSNLPEFNTDAANYDLTSGSANVTISFEASANNQYNGSITFLSECGNISRIVDVKGRINSPEVANATEVINAVIGSNQTNQVDINNPNPDDFNVTDAYVGDAIGNPLVEFSVSNTAFTVPGNDKYTLGVTYTPNPANPVDVSGFLYLVVEEPCDVILKNILIDGNPDLSVAKLVVNDSEDYIGNITMINTILTGSGGFLTSGTEKVEFTLQYDNTILSPQSGTTVSANEVSYTMTLPSPFPGMMSFSMPFEVLNGLPVTFSDLVITDVKALNSNNEESAGVNSENGRFSLIMADGKVETYNMSASPGDEFEIILDINDDDYNLDEILHKDIKVTMEYNFTVMQPKNGNYKLLTGDRAEMDVTGSIDYSNKPKENLLQAPLAFAKIPMIAKLGNSQLSEVNVKAVEVLSDGIAEFALDTATFTLTGVCEEGGNLRLFSLSDLQPSIKILENPMQSNSQISLTTIEKGIHKVILFDVKGQKTVIDTRNITTQGSYIIDISVDNLLTGTYSISFETPTQEFHKNFIIIK